MIVKTLKFVIPFLFFFILIGFFPMITDLIILMRNKELTVNYQNYIKKNILIDSLSYFDNDGANATNVYGYSKELNNYKTEVLFGIRENYSVIENSRFDVWYKKGSKYAYPANKKDLVFPIKSFLFNSLKLPVIWIISLSIFIYLYKIATKKGMFNKKNNL